MGSSGFERVSRPEAPMGETRKAVRVWLLGGFRVGVGSRIITPDAWRLRKVAALVKLLALAPGHRLHREQAMDLLWPELGRTAASNNLRQALHAARRILASDRSTGSRYLGTEGTSLVLCPQGDLWVDVEAFQEAAAIARRARDPASYRAAIELYSGELLPEDLYEAWAEDRRRELGETHVSLLLGLAWSHEEREDYGSAIEARRKVTRGEPTNEEAHAGLMRLYALSGRKADALRQYELFEETTLQELGTGPSASTRALREEIASGRFPPEAAQPPRLPPKEASEPPRHNLPVPRTSFVGRGRELGEIKRTLTMTRHLTLIGTGGSGKTRLALRVAADLAGAYPDGVHLVALARLSEPELVTQEVADTLGVREEPGRPLVEVLAGSVGEKTLLLVADNCEHLIDAVARLIDFLLVSCPHLHVMATSREPLGVEGEVLFPVPPLPVPAVLPVDFTRLGDYDSVRLFVERTRLRLPGFSLVRENVRPIAEVCRRLEGLPLAIELAAARMGTLATDQMAERLEDSLSLLSAGPRTASARQRTMRAAIGWSYGLLSEPEKVTFGRLSVFSAGFTLEAAEAVCQGGIVDEGELLNLVSGLVDKSLVVAETTAEGRVRYRMLELVRQYAHEKLEEGGEADVVHRRHAVFFLTLAGVAEPQPKGAQQEAWLNRLESEHDNVRAALSWSLGEHDPGLGLRLAAAFWQFWDGRGYLGEGSAWLREALAKGGDAGGADARATALYGLGHIVEALGDFERAEACQEDAFALYEQLGNRLGVAESLNSQGLIAFRRGDTGRASSLFEKGLEAARESGNQVAIRRAINGLAVMAFDAGDHERARRLWDDALVLGRKHGDRFGVARVLINVGFVDIAFGNYERSTELLEEALAIARELNSRELRAHSLMCLGLAATLRGKPERAQTMLVESLEIDVTREAKADIDEDLEALATTAGALGQHARAARLWGAAESLRGAIGAVWALPERMVFEPLRDAARSRLDEAAWAAEFARGRAMGWKEAVEYALSEEGISAPEQPQDHGIPALTPREQEIAALVAQGMTNRRIAAELVLSEHTVATHVRRILKKLDLHSRAELAARISSSRPPLT
jgi:predicted ATPase/DNA-binding SARP family transcriptional activator/DNA-binding CsgD family transcriptional regulator/Tfp pilus assembly protein PilF